MVMLALPLTTMETASTANLDTTFHMEIPVNWWISSSVAPTMLLILPSLSAIHVPQDTCFLATNASSLWLIALNIFQEQTFALCALLDSPNPQIGAVVLLELFQTACYTTVSANAFNAIPISQDFQLTDYHASTTSSFVPSTTHLLMDARLVSLVLF